MQNFIAGALCFRNWRRRVDTRNRQCHHMRRTRFLQAGSRGSQCCAGCKNIVDQEDAFTTQLLWPPDRERVAKIRLPLCECKSGLRFGGARSPQIPA